MVGENSFGVVLTSFRQERLKAARAQRDKLEADKWSTLRVAKDLGVTRQTYSGWENGHHLPEPNDLRAIVRIFRLSDEERDALYLAAAQVSPKRNYLPQKNDFFTGRETHLERLDELLQECGIVGITQAVSISGLGGIGKTQLALQYAHHHFTKNTYRAALWVNAASKETLQASYGELTRILDLPEQDEVEDDKRVQAVKEWLEGHSDWLLVMDNADDLALARSFLPSILPGHVIFTTRSQIVGDSGIVAQLNVEAMETEEGLLFLLRRSKTLGLGKTLDDVALDIRKTAMQIVEILGGHPLALDQAGSYIDGTGVSVAKYIQLYQEERRFLLDRRGLASITNDHPESVVVTIEMSFKQACQQHPMAQDVLYFCSFLHPDSIPEVLFQYDDSFKFDTITFNESIEILRRYSLIKRDAQYKSFSVHRLVQAVLSDAMPADLRMQWIERVMQTINASFPKAEFSNLDQHGRLVLHEMVCAQWAMDEPISILRTADIAYSVSTHLIQRGMFPAAETLLTRALWIYEQHIGDDNPNIAASLVSMRDSLVVIYSAQDRYWEAEQLILRLLVIQGKHLGISTSELGKSLCLLAFLCIKQGKYGQAASLYQQVLTLWEEHLGFQNPEAAIPVFGLGLLFYMLGDDEQAEKMFRGALSIRELRLGASHPLTQGTKLVYMEFLHSIGRDAEAAALETNDETPR